MAAKKTKPAKAAPSADELTAAREILRAVVRAVRWGSKGETLEAVTAAEDYLGESLAAEAP